MDYRRRRSSLPCVRQFTNCTCSRRKSAAGDDDASFVSVVFHFMTVIYPLLHLTPRIFTHPHPLTHPPPITLCHPHISMWYQEASLTTVVAMHPHPLSYPLPHVPLSPSSTTLCHPHISMWYQEACWATVVAMHPLQISTAFAVLMRGPLLVEAVAVPLGRYSPPLTCSLASSPPLARSPARSIGRLMDGMHPNFLTHTHSVTLSHSLTHSVTQPLTHSLSHSLSLTSLSLITSSSSHSPSAALAFSLIDLQKTAGKSPWEALISANISCLPRPRKVSARGSGIGLGMVTTRTCGGVQQAAASAEGGCRSFDPNSFCCE